jgi:GH18 family chitinase/lysophospholipase L1-like esterase
VKRYFGWLPISAAITCLAVMASPSGSQRNGALASDSIENHSFAIAAPSRIANAALPSAGLNRQSTEPERLNTSTQRERAQNPRSNSPSTDVIRQDAHSPKGWVMGYYASWQTNLYPVKRIDFSAITEIGLAHWLTTANGTLQPSDLDTEARAIVSAAHHAGREAIMVVGGADDSNFAFAATPENRGNLIRSILAKIDGLNLDGVDLDWESNINDSNFIALTRALRDARRNLVITVPLDPGPGTSGELAKDLSPYSDQLNMMTYGEGGTYPGWVSWYFSALAGDGPDHPSSVDLFVRKWTEAGVPREKIGVGIGFYGKGWTAPVTGALQQIRGSRVAISEMPYGASIAQGGGLLTWFYNKPGSTYKYDAGPPQQPSLSIPDGITPPGSTAPITWVTYEDPASISAKADFVRTQGLGGVAIWTLNEGATNSATGRNPLLDSVKQGFLKSGPAPMPLIATTKASVAGATHVALADLPPTLTLVDVNWWNGNTSFDDSVGNYGDYGRPSEYYIEASSNGADWTELTHVTGNTYSGRQFVFDFSGKGYKELRLRIVSIVGTNAGNITLNLHDAAEGATDTYLLLGDSITSNCWEAQFPSEIFGKNITEQRPGRSPVVTEGGIPGLLSGSPLSSQPYGIPVIRRWLKDFPAVKYVGLSYGTNDANENVPAGVYYVNMKAMVQEVIAAGKTPVIPTIVASPSENVRASAPKMNAELSRLEAEFPSIIKGPDLWNLMASHSEKDGWFSDALHPSQSVGCVALQHAWAEAILSSVYPQ